MAQPTKNKEFRKALFEKIVPKVEIISIVILAIGIVFKFLKLQGAGEMLMISLTSYAAICYLSGFQKIDSESWFDNALIKSAGISSAVLIIGIQFVTLELPGGTDMVMIGGVVFSLTFVVVFFKNINTESEVFKPFFIRMIKTFFIVGAVVITTYIMNG